jgi:heme exporter protein C
MWLWFHKLSSPPHAYRAAGTLRPWFLWPAIVLMIVAAYGGLVMAPQDYQQKDAFRIIYVHAPSAILSLAVYVTMAIAAAVGKPMWGTWWEWDPRLTSELILLFLYLGYMALRSSFDDLQRADRASAILAIVGVVNVPIVKYSVVWWNSLHQGPSISKLARPSIDGSMLWPLLLMLLAFMLFFCALLCDRVRAEILRRERKATWLNEAVS